MKKLVKDYLVHTSRLIEKDTIGTIEPVGPYYKVFTSKGRLTIPISALLGFIYSKSNK